MGKENQNYQQTSISFGEENPIYREICKLPILNDQETTILYTQEKTAARQGITFWPKLSPEEQLLRHFGDPDIEDKYNRQLEKWKLNNKQQYQYLSNSTKHSHFFKGYIWKNDKSDLAFYNEEVKDKLINGHLQLVFTVAQLHFLENNCEYDFDDLFQEGTQALITAIHRFTPFSKNVSFIDYAKVCITGRIQRFIRMEGRQHDEDFLFKIITDQPSKNENENSISHIDIQSIINTLPEEEKFLVCIHYDENWQAQNSYLSIATLMGKSEYWVEKRIKNAKRKIREQVI